MLRLPAVVVVVMGLSEWDRLAGFRGFGYRKVRVVHITYYRAWATMRVLGYLFIFPGVELANRCLLFGFWDMM